MNLFSHKRDLREIIGELQVGAQKEREEAYNTKVKQLTSDAKKEIEKKVAQENHYKTAEEKAEDDCYRSLIKGIIFEE